VAALGTGPRDALKNDSYKAIPSCVAASYGEQHGQDAGKRGWTERLGSFTVSTSRLSSIGYSPFGSVNRIFGRSSPGQTIEHGGRCRWDRGIGRRTVSERHHGRRGREVPAVPTQAPQCCQV